MTFYGHQMHLRKRGVYVKKREPKDPSDKHFRISMFKSVVRLAGYAVLPVNLVAAALFLIAAEVLGIVEEL